ncbi:MAG: hypothetical protein WEB59_08695 [Thermoanaerobaculia bacterium]
MRLRGRTCLAAAGILVLASAGADAQSYHFRPERARRPLELAVRPGDRLRIEAGGCFRAPDQTLVPLLQSDRDAEQGLLFIPGVTMSFVPIADLAGRDLVVPPNLEYPDAPRIWIDWGRFRRDPLETSTLVSSPLPCDSPNRQPHLDIRVTAGSTPDEAAAGTLTLQLSRYDRNLLPFNPTWAGGGQRDVCRSCDGFRLERRADRGPWIPALRSPRCTLQRPSLDWGGCSPRWEPCREEHGRRRGRGLSGHVNFGPATYTGKISTVRRGPVHIARDGDAEFFLEPDGGGGLIAQNPGSKYDGKIGLEFSTAQTIRWFRTPWWRQFPFRRVSYRPYASLLGNLRRHAGERAPYPSLDRRPGTVIGLFGVDNAHDAHSELHPVYAVAVQTAAAADRETWQVFVRNWGTEGDCGGRLDHRMDFSRLAVPLPAGAGPWAAAQGRFFDHGLPFADWRVYAGNGAPILVVDLPPDRPCAVVEGELILRREKDGGTPLHGGEPPLSEPARWNSVPGGDQLCTRESWFLPVP